MSKKPVAAAFANLESEQEQWQWIQDEEQGYREAKVVKANADGSMLVELDGASKLFKKEQLGPAVLSRADINSDYPDMVRMSDVNEATILRNLRTRFYKDLIYTNIGSILVALNPFKRIDCYGKKFAEEHKNTPPGESSDPHVFQTAANAYRGKSVERRNQSIIISGESGAGKTEATKHCLQYFAMVAGSAEGNMQDKLLAANPVLEAFGNAKTVRNNNSSRFGKWMEVHFDGRFAICGCQILNYLLEKSRIVFQTNLERNYHIFYQLPRASSPELLALLGLTRDPSHYGYTKHSYLKDDINDKAEFEDVMHSFAALEFGPPEYEPLFFIAAGLLHLSNIEFQEIDEDSCSIDSVSPVSKNGLVTSARLLGMDADELQKGLTEKLIVARSERVNSPLSAAKANNARDSLTKALYGRMFDWLVKQVNSKMDKALPGAGGIIGVLDIFGFEIFVNNSFEQLCAYMRAMHLPPPPPHTHFPPAPTLKPPCPPNNPPSPPLPFPSLPARRHQLLQRKAPAALQLPRVQAGDDHVRRGGDHVLRGEVRGQPGRAGHGGAEAGRPAGDAGRRVPRAKGLRLGLPGEDQKDALLEPPLRRACPPPFSPPHHLQTFPARALPPPPTLPFTLTRPIIPPFSLRRRRCPRPGPASSA
jgi:myosin heavy subunit